MVDPAVFPYHQRLSQNPDDAEALFVLWQWYGDRGEFQQLASLVEQTAARRHDPASAADLYFRAGELWSKNLGRADKAVSSYRRAFELDHTQTTAAEAARAIYGQLNNPKQAVQIVERQLAYTGEPSDRLPLLRDLGSLRAQLGDPSGQAAALEEVIRVVPDDYSTMRELAAAYLARAELPDSGGPENAMRAANLLVTIAQGLGGEHEVAFAEAALDAWGGDETAYAIVRDAYAAERREGDLALRQINFIAANPDSPSANRVRRELSRAYAAAEQYDDAIGALEPLVVSEPDAARELAELYGRAGRHADRAEMLLALPPSNDPKRRLAELREVADVLTQQGDRERVAGVLRAILAIDAADPEALAFVEDDLRERGAWDELRQVLQAAARAPGAPLEGRRVRLREVAVLSEQKLHDAAGAVEAWRQLLAIDPANNEANAALEKSLTRAERWDDLARHLEKRAIGATERAERKPLWERLAEIHKTRRKDFAREAEAWLSLWSDEQEDDAVALKLVDARKRAGDMAGAAEVLRFRAEAVTEAGGQEAARRWSELAQHHEAQRERDDALRAWQQVATLDPASPAAWEAVEKLLELTGRLDLLLETLIAHAEGPAGEKRAASLHARAADVARILGDLPTAQFQAEAALRLNPDDDGPAGLLAELYEASDDPQLPTFLRDRAERLPDGEPRVLALRRLASYLGRVAPEQAPATWEQVREAARRAGRSDDPEALDALVGYSEARNDLAQAAHLLELAARASSDPAARAAFWTRRADALERIGNRGDDALRALWQAATEDPTDPAKLDRIASLAGSINQPESVADAWEKRLALFERDDEPDDEARAALAAKLAELCEQALDDTPRALRALEIQYDADPADNDLVARMVQRYEQAERWPDVLKYLVVLSEVAEGDELADLSRRIAFVAEHKLGDGKRAFEALASPARDGDDAALNALRGVATRAKMLAEFADLLAELATNDDDGLRRAARWRELAELREGPLEDRGAAVEAAVQAVVAAGDGATDNDLGRVERLASLHEEPRRVSEAYAAVIAAADDAARVREVALRAAKYLERAGAADSGFDLLASSVSRAGGDDELLDALERLAAAAGRGEELFIALDKKRNAAKDDSGKLQWVLRAARAAFVRIGDREIALSYVQQAIQLASVRTLDEDKLDALEAQARAIDELVPAAAARQGVVDMYSSHAVEHGEDDPRVASVLDRRGARIAIEELDNRQRAYELLQRAAARWAADERTLDALESVAKVLRKERDVAKTYAMLADEAYDSATGRALRLRRVSLLESIGRDDDAIDGLRSLIELAPKDLEPLRKLQALLRKRKRHQDLLLALERELELSAGPDRVNVLREIARVWDDGLKNAFEAKDAWKRVLKADPDDGQAREALDRLEKRKRTEPEPDEDLLDAPPAEEPEAEAAEEEQVDEALEAEPESADDLHAVDERSADEANEADEASEEAEPVGDESNDYATGEIAAAPPEPMDDAEENATGMPPAAVAPAPRLGALPRAAWSSSVAAPQREVVELPPAESVHPPAMSASATDEFRDEPTGVLDVGDLLDSMGGADVEGEEEAEPLDDADELEGEVDDVEPLPEDDPLAEGLARGAISVVPPKATIEAPQPVVPRLRSFADEGYDDGATGELSMNEIEEAAEADDAEEAEELEPEPLEETKPGARAYAPAQSPARRGNALDALHALDALDSAEYRAAPEEPRPSPSPAKPSPPARPARDDEEDDTPSLDDLARMVASPRRQTGSNAPPPPPPARKG